MILLIKCLTSWPFEYVIGLIGVFDGKVRPFDAINAEPNESRRENSDLFCEHIITIDCSCGEVVDSLEVEDNFYGLIGILPSDPFVTFIDFIIIESFDAINQLSQTGWQMAGITYKAVICCVH